MKRTTRASRQEGVRLRRVRRLTRGVSLGAFAVLTALCPDLGAEPVPALDLRGFQPPTHPEALVYLEPTTSPSDGEWNLGLEVSYGYRPVVIADPLTGRETVPVRHQLSLDLTGSIGLGDRLALGLDVPTVVYQHGDSPPEALALDDAPPAALGDVAVDARATLVAREPGTSFGLAVLGRLTLPTGNPRSYAAENALRSEVRLLGELGVLGSIVRGTAGARLRGEEHTLSRDTFGHDLPWGLGLLLKPQTFGLDRSGRYLVALEAHGAVALTPKFAALSGSPAALALAARRTFGNAYGVLGAELPLDGAQGLPSLRTFVLFGYAPRTRDTDGDGLDDDHDACIDRPEDRDGFEDQDGCPEIDNDADGIPDATDRCPDSVEDLDGFEDDDGCADPDDDGDGTPDVRDACPREPGPSDPDPKRNGCPARDRDMDGIPDPRDRCPTRAEDRDGFQDDDGCPDLDDDHDGLRDTVDPCPRAAGPRRSDPALDGCPSPDLDGDALEGDQDRCPEDAEDYDGVDDDDGCPDPDAGMGAPAGTPLVRLERVGSGEASHFELTLHGRLGFEPDQGGVSVAAGSQALLRALAELSNQNPGMVLMVGVRPLGTSAARQQEALTRSFAIVDALRSLTHRDDAAETIGWSAIVRAHLAHDAGGIGFLVLVPPEARAVPNATPTSATPTSATPTSATPTSATPTSATPTNATPTNATPTSATPTSATPTNATTGKPKRAGKKAP